jgi:AcrR family transcriptional regulator
MTRRRVSGGSGVEPAKSPTTDPCVIRRRPGQQVTRESILCAGRKLFIQRGFGASMREIAVEAGIDHALVYRHFESKIDLFNQIFDQPLNPAEAGEALTERLLTAPGRIDDLVHVAVRSAADPAATRLICEIIERRLIPPLAQAMGGEGATERARLLLALAAGVEVVSDGSTPVLEVDAMAPFIADIVREILTRPRISPLDQPSG